MTFVSEVVLELKKDNEFFERNRDRLIEKYGFGKYVGIHRQRVLAVGDAYEDVEMKCYERIGPEPCVVRRCVPPEQEVYQIL